MFSTRLLTQFIAVAEELNFGRAAVRVHMAQSPLSQAIRRLEQNLGVELFIRTKRSVILTTAGEIMLQQAKAMLRAEHAAIALVRRSTDPEVGKLAVGFVGTVAYGIVPKLLREFRSLHPGVRMDIAEMTTSAQIKGLKSSQLDAGLARLPLPPESGLETLTIETDRYALAVPSSSKWARRRTISLASLKDAPFVAYSHDRVPILHSYGVSMCLEDGFYPNIICEAWQASSILSFVASGIGVALVPSRLARLSHKGVKFCQLSSSSPNTQLDSVVMWLKDNKSSTLMLFLNALRAEVSK